MGSLEKQLKDIAKKTNKDILKKLTYSDIFNEKFMAKNTEFKTIEELLKHCNPDIKNHEDYKRMPIEIINKTVKEKTKFNSWEEMKEKASDEYLKAELNKRGIKAE